jgi:hypothetical protein
MRNGAFDTSDQLTGEPRLTDAGRPLDGDKSTARGLGLEGVEVSGSTNHEV